MVADNPRSIGTHKRRCKVIQAVKEFCCDYDECKESFDLFKGVQQHKSKKHKSQYNKTLPQKRVFAWEERELYDLAKVEIQMNKEGLIIIIIIIIISIQLKLKVKSSNTQKLATLNP